MLDRNSSQQLPDREYLGLGDWPVSLQARKLIQTERSEQTLPARAVLESQKLSMVSVIRGEVPSPEAGLRTVISVRMDLANTIRLPME